MPGYNHLDRSERDQIAELRAQGLGATAIAEVIGRDKSTVSRELGRNAHGDGTYRPVFAEGSYLFRRQRQAILETDVGLRGFVIDRLAEGWAPEQIAGWLRRGIEIGLRAVSTETIYAFIFRSAQQAEKLWRYLTRRKASRGRRARRSRDVLEPAVERYRERNLRCYFRGDAAFASPDIYEFLEDAGFLYAIRLKANNILQGRIAHLLIRPVGRPPNHVRRYYANFSYKAGSWDTKRRVVAKLEWHPGELYPRVGFIVTNLSRPAERVVAFYNHRGTAEQYIKEGKYAIKWTRLSCSKFRNNEVRLQLHALAYNLGKFMRTLALPKEVEHWSLTTLREKLVKIDAKVVHHGRYVTFQLAEVAVPGNLFREILGLINDLRRRPVLA